MSAKSDALRALVLSQLAQGKTVNQIAKERGMSRAHVHYYARRRPERPERQGLSDKVVAAILEGRTPHQIAKRLGVPLKTVYSIRERRLAGHTLRWLSAPEWSTVLQSRRFASSLPFAQTSPSTSLP